MFATAIDPDGNIWMSGTGLLKFDVQTHQFKQYKLPIPTGTEYSENTWQGWHNLPGKPHLPIDQTIYDVKSDSKGMIWACSVAVKMVAGSSRDESSKAREAIYLHDRLYCSGFYYVYYYPQIRS